MKKEKGSDEYCAMRERVEQLELRENLRRGRTMLIVLLILYFSLGVAFGWVSSLAWGAWF